MTTNKMEQVAGLFGKKLGEDFKVKYGCVLTCEAVAKFTENSFRVKRSPRQDYWGSDTDLLEDLLVGRAVIVDE